MGPVCLDALSPGRLRVAILRVVERAYLVAEVAESAPFPLSPVVALFHVSCLAQVMLVRPKTSILLASPSFGHNGRALPVS